MILYFSGTGNSRYAALRLHEVLGGQLVDLNQRLKDLSEIQISLSVLHF